jgi:hypothetical protein
MPERIKHKFGGVHGGTYFQAGKNMAADESLLAAKLLSGIHYVRRIKEGGKWSVYIMDKHEKNTY